MSQQTVFTQLDTKLIKALDALSFKKPTDIQQEAIPFVLEGMDLMASAETGSGKTAAFLLPILDRLLAKKAPNSGTRVLILAPTRELARQIHKQALELTQFTGIQSGLITGGQSFREQRAAMRKNPEIIIGTPGRILDHSQQGATDFADLEYLVLDEADKMLDMGFSDDVIAISNYCSKKRQSLLFSATLQGAGIKHITNTLLKNPRSITLNTYEDAQANIHQSIILADDLEHKEKLVGQLLQNEKYRKAVVFCNTKTQVERLSGLLRYHKLKVGHIHGDIKQDTRNHIMVQFRDGKFDVLIASDVAARGLDVKDVDLVLNFDMAQSLEDYIHRIGRTGRAGAEGSAISLITHKDWNLMVTIQNKLGAKFEVRTVQNLVAKYQGPQKLKKSGKAAGKKKRKHAGKKGMTARDKKRLAKKQDKKQDKKTPNADVKPKKKFGGIKRSED
ncbi:DEAD/DEAH box helicase [Kangiella sediminilitoris]|uniref:DEAD/DEAH box helicase domain protein n=1 Tax=Kangiella sediminilitoris TaxID=1144748 RepID=A0A1B3B9U5_9GAMM|nr:DEAD/DEAH box helicase [Kangiella sediminilitoris]AOE49555.1 DEAD/DEAH box helicase domain protein [Kangiella sediminilitoris]